MMYGTSTGENKHLHLPPGTSVRPRPMYANFGLELGGEGEGGTKAEPRVSRVAETAAKTV